MRRHPIGAASAAAHLPWQQLDRDLHYDNVHKRTQHDYTKPKVLSTINRTCDLNASMLPQHVMSTVS
jgi:hypothetical protein